MTPLTLPLKLPLSIYIDIFIYTYFNNFNLLTRTRYPEPPTLVNTIAV